MNGLLFLLCIMIAFCSLFFRLRIYYLERATGRQGFGMRYFVLRKYNAGLRTEQEACLRKSDRFLLLCYLCLLLALAVVMIVVLAVMFTLP